MTTTKHTNGTRVQKWIAFLLSVAADVAEAQAERYWDYTDGAFSDWWTQGPDDTVDLQYFGSCSDHASITGATGANGTEKLAFGEGIPSVYIFWGDNIGDGRNDVTEQNYHVVGDIYEWPADEDVFGETRTYTVQVDQVVLPFTDIEQDAYYYDALVWGYSNGIVLGTTETTFSPDENVTRAQVIAFLYRLAGEPESGAKVPFTDVPSDAYYAQALAWAAENKIAYGVSATAFEPDRAVTREEFVTFLYRDTQLHGSASGALSDLSGFQDASGVSAWAQDSVAWAAGQGIVVGVESDVLAPQGTATRAQAVEFLYRYSQLG